MKASWLIAVALGGAVVAQTHDTMVYALPAAVQITYVVPVLPAVDETLYNFEAIRLMYKPLLWIDRNIRIDYARSIAESITTKDGQHYTIRLNPKWHWSDGLPVTAADLVFDYSLIHSVTKKNISDYGSWGIGGFPDLVRSFKAVGPYEVKVTLTHPVNALWFESNGLSQLTPLPKQAWDRYPGDPAKTLAWLQSHGDDPQFIAKSPVDGPFKIYSFVNNDHYTFVANPRYDGHKPSYTYFEMRYFTTTDAEYNALRVGEVQVGYLPTHLFNQRSIPGYTYVPASQYDIAYIYVNFKNPKYPFLKDHVVREALQLAVDQPGYVKVLLHGEGVAQYGPVPYVPPTYLSPYLKTHVPYPYNPTLGRKLLEQDGWHLVHGVMTKGGYRLEFLLPYSSGNLLQQQEAELFAEAAAQEGIRITLKPVPFDTLIGDLSNPSSWSLMYYGGWIYGLQPYPTNFGLFASQGGSNQSGLADPGIDRALERAHQAYPSTAQALDALYAYEDYLATYLPVIWMPSADILYEIAQNVQGARQHISPIGNISPQYWSYR